MSRLAVRLGPDMAGTYMSPEEFDAVTEYDENYRYELIHGVLVVSPIPSEMQASPNEELGYWLRVYRDSHSQGATIDETLPERYVRTTDSRRLADRVIWAGLGRLPKPKEDVPTIVVEFVSKGKRNRLRDYVTKRDEYLAVGVKEYWVIDRFQRTLTVYRAGGRKVVVGEKKTYKPPLLPGFELPLARLLSLADRYEEQD